jgi:secreted PhoX family phosphatase
MQNKSSREKQSMNNSFFTSTLSRESFDRVTSCAQKLMMNQPFDGAAAAAAAEVVDKNRNNFSHTTPKELQMVAKDAGSR